MTKIQSKKYNVNCVHTWKTAYIAHYHESFAIFTNIEYYIFYHTNTKLS